MNLNSYSVFSYFCVLFGSIFLCQTHKRMMFSIHDQYSYFLYRRHCRHTTLHFYYLYKSNTTCTTIFKPSRYSFYLAKKMFFLHEPTDTLRIVLSNDMLCLDRQTVVNDKFRRENLTISATETPLTRYATSSSHCTQPVRSASFHSTK